MDQEMTIGEVARALARIEQGQRELRDELASRMNQMVPMQVYTLEISALRGELVELKADLATQEKEVEADLAAVRDDLRTADRQRIIDRRWWLTAVGIPVAALLIQYAGLILGGGS
ncbi:hypothetical protein GCM10027294_43890 [Marinactinospora endophytica]